MGNSDKCNCCPLALLKFRRLLQKHNRPDPSSRRKTPAPLKKSLFFGKALYWILANYDGLSLRQKQGKRDGEMHVARKGNKWHAHPNYAVKMGNRKIAREKLLPAPRAGWVLR